MMHADADLAVEVAALGHEAGRAIVAVYDAPDASHATAKEDGSPLTRADLAAHRVLSEGLARLTPDVPVLSEESDEEAFAARRGWARYWLIDPLDGTKEFLNRNGEFTVNVALIEVARAGMGQRSGRPVLGVVHVPITGATYTGVAGMGAWREDAHGRADLAPATPDGPVRVVASRSHGNPATDAFIAGLEAMHGGVERTSSGSSLKLCRVAEGSAHYYPRIAPTMEWDTAAAQAVVEAAGGVVWRFGTRQPLSYAKGELRNPPFVVAYGPEAPLPKEATASDTPVEDA